MPPRWSVRTVTAGLSVLGVLGLAILPPQHLHASGTHDGYRLGVVHRHFEAHHSAGAVARVAHEDAAPTWLVSAYVNTDRATGVDRIDTCIEHDAPKPAPRQVSPVTSGLVSISVHDPPPGAAFGLRAPPLPVL